MKNDITVIATVRDREAWRFKKQVQSIREGGADPAFILVDYGSNRQNASAYSSLCTVLGAKYIRVESEGRPWNKCHAINIGVRISETPFIVTSDVDMIYVNDPFTYGLRNISENEFYHIDTYWLPRNGDRTKARFAGKGNPGGFQLITQKAFDEAGGYDEKIVFWGQEDLDWPSRLINLGYKQTWLPSEYRIYHQWHKPANKGLSRPATVSFDSVIRLYSNALHPRIEQEWGKTISEVDRPIINYLRKGGYKVVHFKSDELESQSVVDRVFSTRNLGFVRLDIGRRNKAACFPSLVIRALNKSTSLIGLSVQPEVNTNIDYLYCIIPVLLSNGLLADYFVETDFSAVYLLWS